MTSPRTSILSLGLCLAFHVSLSAAAVTGPAPGSTFWVLGDYLYPSATESDFQAEYAGRSVGNATDSCPECKASLTSVKDESGDFARLTYTLPKTGHGPLFARVGMQLPLDKNWFPLNDMRFTKRVMFKARTSSAYADGVNVMVSLESPAFPFQSAGYTRLKTVTVGKDWAWYAVGIREFAYISWMKIHAAAATKNVVIYDGYPFDPSMPRSVTLNARAVMGKLLNIDSASSPDYDKDSVNALKNVQGLRFEIDPILGSGATSLDSEYAAASQDVALDIDSVLFDGTYGPGNDSFPQGRGCIGIGETIEDFDMTNARKQAAGIAVNYAGGYWYAISDRTPTSGSPNDAAVGRSWIAPLDPADPDSAWGIDSLASEPAATMLAVLNKDDANVNPHGGWAELATTLATEKKMQKGVNAYGMMAIQFDILAGGIDPDQPKFDRQNLDGVVFKIGKASVPDSESYFVRIPFRQISARANAGNFVSVCVDVDVPKQPYRVDRDIKVMAVDSLTHLAWRLSLPNGKVKQADSSLIQIRAVKFFGCNIPEYSGCTDIRPRQPSNMGVLAANYHNGLQLSYSLPAAAQIEVLRMDGSVVASRTGAASAQNLSIPLKLDRGTYLVVVRGGGQVRSATLPVVGR